MKFRMLITGLMLAATAVSAASGGSKPVDPGPFPVTMQFNPVPSGKGWKGEPGPLSDEVIRDTIDNMIEHGATGIYCPIGRQPFPVTPEDAKKIIQYAESRRMYITHQTGGLEMFRRKPAEAALSPYSPEYSVAVKKHIETRLATLSQYTRLYNVFGYMDEPFNEGEEAFGYGDDIRAEFKRRYGYELPPDLGSIRDNPKVWLDVINFRSDYFPDAWRQVYKIIKETHPNFKVIMTHDSHNTFGGGVGAESKIGIDDVFHWGGDFSDIFVFDIYPYMMTDFRYGELRKLVKPRMSQMHYAFGQMRNLTREYGKELGFWFGVFNDAWFKNFMTSDLKAKYWAERETSTTAVAQGSNFILSGYGIPQDARHWEELGRGLRLIHSAGPGLLEAPKFKAKACFLFPRTQYIQLQEEYWNVGLSYELFLRSFGELDVLHEEQIKDSKLDGYNILCLFDVKLLPQDTAQHIAEFVKNGGVVIADCVPQMDAYKQPIDVMSRLFGVQNAVTSRIIRHPQDGSTTTQPQGQESAAKETVTGSAFGQRFDITVVSPRPCEVTEGNVLLKTSFGRPALVHRRVGKGHVFLLGFCAQDTYFQTYADEDSKSREQLYGLLGAITDSVGVRSHVYSSNPDIEASLRANSKEAYLFIIDHEAESSMTDVRLTDLPFEVKRMIDIETGELVRFDRADGEVSLRLEVPMGGTKILRILRR